MLVTKRQKRGAEVSAANLSIQLQEMGHTVIFTGLYQPSTDIIDINGIVTEDLGGTDNVFFSYNKLRHLLNLIKKHDVNIIQANGSDTLRYAVAATFINRQVKLVYRNISKISYWINGSTTKKIYNRFLFKRVDAVASVGNHSANDLIATLKISPEKVNVIRRGIPIHLVNKKEARCKIAEEISINKDKTILVWAGALSREKNPLFMMEVMSMLQKMKIPCFLILAGVGYEESKIKAVIEKNQLNNIQLVGYRSDISELLAAADLLVLTSNIEGVPGIVLEAAIQQTPAIAINRGGVAEAILDGKTGLLLQNHDVQLFANAIEQLINNRELRINFGNSASEWVKKEFNEAQNAEAFSKLYHSIVS